MNHRSIYEVSRETVLDCFSPYLHGNNIGLFCVISSSTLNEESLQALINTANRLGYKNSIAFIQLQPEKYPSLKGKDLFLVIEALDPLCLVCCDAVSSSALATAYQCSIPLDCPTSLLGRPIRAFSDFAHMLNQDQTKQKAWQLLKKLPSIN